MGDMLFGSRDHACLYSPPTIALLFQGQYTVARVVVVDHIGRNHLGHRSCRGDKAVHRLFFRIEVNRTKKVGTTLVICPVAAIG